MVLTAKVMMVLMHARAISTWAALGFNYVLHQKYASICNKRKFGISSLGLTCTQNLQNLAFYLWAVLQSNTIWVDSGVVGGVSCTSIVAIFISLIVAIQGNTAVFIMESGVQYNIWNQLHDFMLI